MATADWARVKSILGAALEKAADERTEFLDAACGGDAALRSEVEVLLVADDRAVDFLPDAGFGPDPAPGERRIGRYRLRELIGEGGMGVVYLAEQDNPRRDVALKLIKGGIWSPELRWRFEHEAALLGRLRHPGIAQIHEAGAAGTGLGNQPFFAMEYVDGPNLIDYADRADLDVRGRLELLARIADAVHHAHQKGVIHRDLKPLNILVDGSGQPKILDFGVARAIEADDGPRPRTITGQFVGTIPYISPEQCTGDSAAIDIRCDVYALGVIGYELLAGRPPFDLGGTTFPNAARVICEQDPAPLRSANRLLRGDVETIISKTLEKERSRRYETASELAADIRRFLNDEPIRPRAASTMYLLWKYARRNRARLLGVAAAVVVVGLGVIAAERTRRADADIRAAAERVAWLSGDMVRLLQMPVQPQVLERDDTLAAIVSEAWPADDSDVLTDPLMRAAFHNALSNLLGERGLYEKAEPHQRNAIELVEQEIGGTNRPAMSQRLVLADLYRENGKLHEIEELARASAPMIQESDDRQYALKWDYLRAEALHDRGLLAEAEALYRRVLQGQRGIPQARWDVLDSRSSIGIVLVHQNKDLDQAVRLLTEVLNERAHRNAGDLRSLSRLHDYLGQAFLAQGRPDEAISELRQAVSMRESALGTRHPDTIRSVSNLGRALIAADRAGEACERFRFALESASEVLRPGHWRLADYRSNLGHCLFLEGHYGRALPLLREAADLGRRHLPDRRARATVYLNRFGSCLQRLGRNREAQLILVEAGGLAGRVGASEARRTGGR